MVAQGARETSKHRFYCAVIVPEMVSTKRHYVHRVYIYVEYTYSYRR